jgi:hypothetical protein
MSIAPVARRCRSRQRAEPRSRCPIGPANSTTTRSAASQTCAFGVQLACSLHQIEGRANVYPNHQYPVRAHVEREHRAVAGGTRRRMTTPLVNSSKHEGVIVLELSNPPANTYSYEMMRQLDAHVLDARFDESVHVLLITGAGEKFFCAGADINMLEGANPYFNNAGAL